MPCRTGCGYFLYYALIAAGLYITIRTRGVRAFHYEMVRVLGDPVAREADGKKTFLRSCVYCFGGFSCGYRYCCGCCFGYCMGGPGAVFWMWVIAAVGAASAFGVPSGSAVKERGKDSYWWSAYYVKRA